MISPNGAYMWIVYVSHYLQQNITTLQHYYKFCFTFRAWDIGAITRIDNMLKIKNTDVPQVECKFDAPALYIIQHSVLETQIRHHSSILILS